MPGKKILKKRILKREEIVAPLETEDSERREREKIEFKKNFSETEALERDWKAAVARMKQLDSFLEKNHPKTMEPFFEAVFENYLARTPNERRDAAAKGTAKFHLEYAKILEDLEGRTPAREHLAEFANALASFKMTLKRQEELWKLIEKKKRRISDIEEFGLKNPALSEEEKSEDRRRIQDMVKEGRALENRYRNCVWEYIAHFNRLKRIMQK